MRAGAGLVEPRTTSSGSKRNSSSAMAAVPTIAFFLIFQRNIMAGLTAGGIRG